jgi:hypothetical protein
MLCFFLECTSESNLQFYERARFKVVEEGELKDSPREGESRKVKLWMMLKNNRAFIPE